MRRIAVLGAAGLVGSVAVGRLSSLADNEIRACVRNPATSWSLIRLGIQMVPVDLRSPDDLDRALKGCSHVVNCALGEDQDLVPCMRNLVAACRRHRVERLVHLSSVTAYGDPPRADCVHESGVPRPKRGTYGWFKAKQDEIALRAHVEGLSTAVLCLPHVTGPNSRFLLSLIRDLRAGRFAFVDGGRHPVVLADVANVAQAIQLALAARDVDGRRVFINDGDAATWRTLVEALAPLAGIAVESLTDVTEPQAAASRSSSLPLRVAAQRVLALPEVRAILQRTVFGDEGKLASWVRSRAKRVAGGTPRLGAPAPPAPSGRPLPEGGLWLQQFRKVPHSIDRARSVLEYVPEISFATSMTAFRNWFGCAHQYGTPFWELARRI